jgi:hypothetical protein
MKTMQEATTIAHSIQRTWADPRLCATFEVTDQPRKWLQYGDRRINACYPTERHPGALVAMLGGQLHSWDGGRFVTIDLSLEDANEVAQWIQQYFQWVLATRADSALQVRIGRFTTAVVNAVTV